MGKIKITREEIKEYNSTPNGHKKFIWMMAGAVFDIMACFGISALIINSYRLPSSLYFYSSLFLLLVIVVLGGELIGIYFGSREQYFYDKATRMVIKNDE